MRVNVCMYRGFCFRTAFLVRLRNESTVILTQLIRHLFAMTSALEPSKWQWVIIFALTMAVVMETDNKMYRQCFPACVCVWMLEKIRELMSSASKHKRIWSR